MPKPTLSKGKIVALQKAQEAGRWVDALGPSTDISWLFGDGNGNHAVPLVSRSRIQIVTGVYSFDPRYLNFLDKLVDKVGSTIRHGVDSEGFCCETGLPKPVDNLRTVAGYGANPISYVVCDNSSFIKELGLPDSYRSKRHQAIFEQMWDITFSEWVPRSLKITQDSTAGFPTFSFSAVWKKSASIHIFNNIDRVLDCFEKRDLDEFAHEWGIVFCFNNGKRSQVDSVGKERISFGLQYALSGGLIDDNVIADKTISSEVVGGFNAHKFSATRERVVQGASFLSNIVLSGMSTGHMYSMFERFSYTFHHTDIKTAVESIPPGYSLVASDIKEYDRSMATFLIDTMLERARLKWDKRLVDWCELQLFAPYYTRPVDIAGKRGQFVGGQDVDPSDLSRLPFLRKRQIFAGNRSGHAWTSLIAKIMKVADTLCVVDDLMGDVLERMESYLRGEMPVKIKNNGDDEILIAPADIVKLYREYRFNPDKQVGYFVAEPEVGQIFSGSMIMKKSEGGFTASPRISTFFEKTFVPERSVGSNFRKYWTIGILERFNSNDNASHPAAVEAVMSTWRDNMSEHFGDLMSIVKTAHQQLALPDIALSEADRAVLRNPRKLFYQYVEEDINPAVLKLVFGGNILPQEYESFQRFYYGKVTGQTFQLEQ